MNSKKLELLKIIKEKKTLLFPNNTTTVAKQTSRSAWLEVLIKAQSLHLVGPERKWTYTRDFLLEEWKAVTLAKYGKVASSKNLNVKANLNEVDKLIIEIYDINLNEEVSRDALDMEFEEKTNYKNQKIKLENTKPSPTRKLSTIIEVNEDEINIENNSVSSKKRKLSTHNIIETFQTENSTKRQKIEETDTDNRSIDIEKQLRIELLEHDIYYRKLQCLRLERELYLPLSKYTISLAHNKN